MKKIFKILFVFVLLIFLSGCTKNGVPQNKPFVAFSDNPINENTVPKKKFKVGEKIYYAIVNPKGFKSHIIRVQVFKQDDKVNILGLSYHSTKDYRLENQQYFLDYMVIHTKGHYYMQVFEITNLEQPKAIGDFFVVD